jgi:uncharacterized repeat protein (TIGR03843 family)
VWIDVDDEVDLGELVRRVDDPALRRIALLDAVLNNADRKGGHVLATPDGSVHGVDHGVCFHVEDKLRTVLWGWAGQPVTEEGRAMLARLAADLQPGADTALRAGLVELVSPAEVDAAHARTVRLLQRGRHPRPGHRWPPIPWPPF